MTYPSRMSAIALIAATICPLARSQSLSRAFNPRLGALAPETTVSTEVLCDEAVADQHTDLSFARYRLDALVPLAQSADAETALTSTVEIMDLATRARLLDARAPLPDHLYDVSLGGFHRRRLDNDWIAGLLLSVGSASDKPFDSRHETSLSATATLQLPIDEHNSHLFFLNYAGNREWLPHVPIPGYAWSHRPSRDFNLLLGLPMSAVTWRPADKWLLEARYFVPRTVHAAVNYELTDDLVLYTGFDWRNDRWLRAERSDHDDRLFYYEKKVAAGVRLNLWHNLSLDLHAGYGFDRFFFEGEDYDDRSDSRISLSDGLFVGARAGLQF